MLADGWHEYFKSLKDLKLQELCTIRHSGHMANCPEGEISGESLFDPQLFYEIAPEIVWAWVCTYGGMWLLTRNGGAFTFE